MSDLLSRLSDLPESIAVGIIGAGAMGHGLYYQTTLTPGMTCVALADIDLQRAISCVRAAGQRFEVAETPEQIAHAIEHQVVCVCSDGALIAASPGVDVVVEASSAIEAAGRFAEQALLIASTFLDTLTNISSFKEGPEAKKQPSRPAGKSA